jgi:hypothetical protein
MSQQHAPLPAELQVAVAAGVPAMPGRSDGTHHHYWPAAGRFTFRTTGECDIALVCAAADARPFEADDPARRYLRYQWLDGLSTQDACVVAAAMHELAAERANPNAAALLAKRIERIVIDGRLSGGVQQLPRVPSGAEAAARLAVVSDPLHPLALAHGLRIITVADHDAARPWTGAAELRLHDSEVTVVPGGRGERVRVTLGRGFRGPGDPDACDLEPGLALLLVAVCEALAVLIVGPTEQLAVLRMLAALRDDILGGRVEVREGYARFTRQFHAPSWPPSPNAPLRRLHASAMLALRRWSASVAAEQPDEPVDFSRVFAVSRTRPVRLADASALRFAHAEIVTEGDEPVGHAAFLSRYGMLELEPFACTPATHRLAAWAASARETPVGARSDELDELLFRAIVEPWFDPAGAEAAACTDLVRLAASDPRERQIVRGVIARLGR